jgi:hypothetical protein
MNPELEQAFHSVHANLQHLPDEYCKWRKETTDGRMVSKSLSADYRPRFQFIRDVTLRNNLAELRMSLDYHLSIFYFLKPGLTFGWQHKLVIYQIIGAIVEGLLTDYLEHLIDNDQNELVKKIAKQRTDSKSFGLGSLVEIYKQANFFRRPNNIQTLENLRDLRNSVHPRSLNRRTNVRENPLMAKSVDEVVRIFDTLIDYMESKYEN